MDEYPTLWEEVSNDTTAGLRTWRLRVPGGWLVSVEDIANDMSSVTFISNPDHRWVLES